MKEKSRVRNAYAISTVSVTLVLFLVGAALYFIANATRATDSIVEQMKVSVVVADSISVEQTTELKSIIDTLPSLNKYKYISKDEAIKDFSEFIGEDVITAFEVNPLPAVYDLYFKKDIDIDGATKEVTDILKDKVYVDEILQQTTQIKQIMSNLAKFKLLILIFGSILLFISIILINNTIRSNIFAKRFIIKSMLLVGATPWFVRKPFLWQSILQGIIASTFAFAMLMVMIYLVQSTVPMVELLRGIEVYLGIYATIAIIGVIFCMILTNIAVGRFIKNNGDNLYIF